MASFITAAFLNSLIVHYFRNDFSWGGATQKLVWSAQSADVYPGYYNGGVDDRRWIHPGILQKGPRARGPDQRTSLSGVQGKAPVGGLVTLPPEAEATSCQHVKLVNKFFLVIFGGKTQNGLLISNHLYVVCIYLYEIWKVSGFMGSPLLLRGLQAVANTQWRIRGGGQYALHTVNDVSASPGVSSPEQVINSIPKQSFRWRFM